MVPAGNEIPDRVVRTTPILAIRRIATVCERVDPLVAVVLKGGIEAAQENAGTFCKLVIGAAIESPTRAVVDVVAQIDAVVMWREAPYGRHRLNIVDAASVEVISAAKEE